MTEQEIYIDRLKKSEWVVQPISLSTARRLVVKYHYAKSGSNTATYTFGLFRKGDDFFETSCVGCTWWIPPTKSSAEATYPEGDWQAVLSLHRMAIAPKYKQGEVEIDMPKNACSFLLAKSIKMIDKKWECLVTYADTWQGHTGGIYKATNWQYMGETKPSDVFQRKGKMMGRKRGPATFTKAEMINNGFNLIGSFAKHKFRIIRGGKIKS